ncbi:anaerobic ribonucleoside-triphosphate reductase activating protein [Desulforamulus ruminis]|uniref:Anaerobic ribonucleoside-triphosphate reductase-activating protein n=1 Tax=Desulforamulus ruminis (strain ATCC 23193 / DSM 2154 / NCIMB 8452 / DL) TaxID=696281 RepID=F6DKB4_DESRL|nr:anaerobic ribonucleoside-triphosphate reductase activating protein [Desulforamulus ruminis]AEG61531.1 anaerobic ribonucleoside-triphosphate reductase activating protein [Desulforamulus ruminis DSM 2154]
MNTTIRLGGITANSVVDGPGLRTVVFLQGCPRRCPGCQNPELLDAGGGREATLEEVLQEIQGTLSPITRGITFSGGDPLMQPEALKELITRLREAFPRLDVWVFTGSRYEEVQHLPLLDQIDVLVDGPFEQDKKDLDLAFRGSANQRLIDVPKSRKTGRVVEWQPGGA